MKSYKKWLKNATMSRKLIPTQLVTIVLVILMSTISIMSLSSVDRMMSNLLAENVQNTEDLNHIIETMYLCRVTGRDILLQEDEDLRADLYTKYLAYFDTLDSQMDEFLLKLDGERATVFAGIIESKNQYKDAMILSADLKNMGGRDDAALTALRSVTPVATDFFGDIAIFLEDEKTIMNQVAESNSNTASVVSAIGGGFALLVIAILIVFIKTFEKSMNGQLVSLKNIVYDIVNTGDTSIEIPEELLTSDEVGDIAKEMKRLTEMLVDYSTITNSLAAKNYRVDVPVKSNRDTLSTSLRSMVNSNNTVLKDIIVTAEHVTTESKNIFSNAQTLEQGVAQQAQSVEALSGLLTNIISEIKDSAQHAENSVSLADKMSSDIDTIDSRVKSMIDAMEKISQFSVEIQRIITTIEDIAFQTNILALNAAVEAARAGSSGKGFAVVADEVRNLATKSSESARQTAMLIDNSADAVQYGEKIAQGVAQALVDVLTSANNISSSIQQINGSTAKQIVSIDSIQNEVDTISDVVYANKTNSVESTQISTKLNKFATDMNSLVSEFKLNN